MLTSVVASLLLACFRNDVFGEEFTQNITKATPEVCEKLYPPGGKLLPSCEDDEYFLFAGWMNLQVAMLFFRTQHNISLRGWIVQCRVNNVLSGTMLPNDDQFVLHCPPGQNNTASAVYKRLRSSEGIFWERPAIFDNYTDFTFRAAILTTSKSFCVKETVLSHELRLQYLQNASLFTDSYLSYSTEVEKFRRARLASSTKKSTTDLFSTRSQKISVTKLLSRSVFNNALGIPDRISSDDY